MNKTIALTTVLAAAIAVSACSPKAQNETAEAAGAVASDVNATAAGAVSTVDAATENAMGRIEAATDNASAKVATGAETAAEKMKAATGDAMQAAGNTVAEAGKDVKK